MRSQLIIVSSALAVVIAVSVLFIYYVYILPRTVAYSKPGLSSIDFYNYVMLRTNWTARELADSIIRDYGVDYVNVTISIYNVLNNNAIVHRDYAVYKPIQVGRVVKFNYVYSDLHRNGHYIEYLIEVGWD